MYYYLIFNPIYINFESQIVSLKDKKEFITQIMNHLNLLRVEVIEIDSMQSLNALKYEKIIAPRLLIKAGAMKGFTAQQIKRNTEVIRE